MRASLCHYSVPKLESKTEHVLLHEDCGVSFPGLGQIPDRYQIIRKKELERCVCKIQKQISRFIPTSEKHLSMQEESQMSLYRRSEISQAVSGSRDFISLQM